MASPAYPIYAFYCLDSQLSGRKRLSLDAIEDLYAQYLAANPHLAPSDTPIEQGEDDDNEDGTEEGVNDLLQARGTVSPPATKGINGSTPSSASASSTPSSMSTTSVNTGASSATSTSSRPSAGNSGNGLRGLVHKLGVARRREQYPLFVTWNRIDRTGMKQLRGCIGTFDDQELDSGLKTYALTSAFEDTRFSPIATYELPSLSASITLLMNFEVCPHPLDWELGTHGIRISFIWRRKRYGATYLPSVAVEQGWDKIETIVSLMRKAGWTGKKDAWEEDAQELRVVRYRGESIKADWEDYHSWRTWLEG